MHFLINVIDDNSGTGSGSEMKAIDAFNDELRANGHWVYANGLCSPKESKLIDNRVNANLIAEDSLYRGDEFYSGFWIIDAASRDEALELALGASASCNRRVELRPFHGS